MLAALHLAAAGSSLSAWSCFLYEPARLRFGRCLLPTVGLISLGVDGSGLRVATRGPDGEHEVRVTPQATWRAGGLELLPAVGRRQQLTLLAEAEPEIGFPPPGEHGTAPGGLGPETISSLDGALELLGSAAPATAGTPPAAWRRCSRRCGPPRPTCGRTAR